MLLVRGSLRVPLKRPMGSMGSILGLFSNMFLRLMSSIIYWLGFILSIGVECPAPPLFVDDLATRLAPRTPQHLLRLAERSSEVSDRSLDSIGTVQNADKAESVPSFLGSGSRSILKDAASQPGQFAKEARYLGLYLHWGFPTSLERDRGIAAAPRAWHDFPLSGSSLRP